MFNWLIIVLFFRGFDDSCSYMILAVHSPVGKKFVRKRPYQLFEEDGSLRLDAARVDFPSMRLTT